MAEQKWTFESLAEADSETLSSLLNISFAPDVERLKGLVYRGWNRDTVGQALLPKFKKAFFDVDGKCGGCNLTVARDTDLRGAWNANVIEGKPVTLGFFRVLPTRDAEYQPLYRAYLPLTMIDYNIPKNEGLFKSLRMMGDFICLPNPDDYSVLLGVGYARVFPWLNVFVTYFVLGYPEPLTFTPV